MVSKHPRIRAKLLEHLRKDYKPIEDGNRQRKGERRLKHDLGPFVQMPLVADLFNGHIFIQVNL